jgi:glycosyltransferase involved in cell wall biosynthesis
MKDKDNSTQRKRILIIDELTYPLYGGQQIRYMELGTTWAAMGYEVALVVIDHTGEMPEYEIKDGVHVYRILKETDYYKKGRFGRKLSTILLFTLKLRKFFKQDFDIIIFSQFPVLPAIFHGIFYKKQRSRSIVDFVEHRSSKLWTKINQILLNSSGTVVCISEHVAECVKKYRRDNLFVIPSLINIENPSIGHKSTFLFLGRLELHKHPETAIRAVLRYNVKYSDNKIIRVIGCGTLYEELVAKYENEPLIEFFGSVPEEIKLDILSKTRMLIFPSEREGLPKTVIEAMAFGIPTITTNYKDNGTKYFVEEEKIGLVAEPMIEDIADKIQMVETKYSEYQQVCLNKRANYYLSINAKKFLNLFL